MKKNTCCSCKKYLKIDIETYCCEECGGEHHTYCSGESDEGSGEYPDESASSICERCFENYKFKKQ